MFYHEHPLSYVCLGLVLMVVCCPGHHLSNSRTVKPCHQQTEEWNKKLMAYAQFDCCSFGKQCQTHSKDPLKTLRRDIQTQTFCQAHCAGPGAKIRMAPSSDPRLAEGKGSSQGCSHWQSPYLPLRGRYGQLLLLSNVL